MKENFDPNEAGENGRAGDSFVPQKDDLSAENPEINAQEPNNTAPGALSGPKGEDALTAGSESAAEETTATTDLSGGAEAEDPAANVGGDGASPSEPTSDGAFPEAPESPKPKKGRVRRFIVGLSIILVFLLLFFVGLCVMLYPAVSNYINTKNASRVINSYDESVQALEPTDYTAYIEAARIYNAQLAASGATLADAFSAGEDDTDKTDEYWSLLDPSGTGVMGYIVIDKVNIKLPIYHGTDEAVLQVGAGHLLGSSLPVGGESTHTVISAHTGLPSAELFTDVDQLEAGDTFEMHILGTVLTYKIDQILTVLPHELDALNIETGKDYATLVTCTPYGINSHRLLIRGERIDNIEAAESSAESTQAVTGAPAQSQAAPEQTSKFQQIKQEAFKIFADIFEKLATWFVAAAEWVMDLLGIDYRQ